MKREILSYWNLEATAVKDYISVSIKLFDKRQAEYDVSSDRKSAVNDCDFKTCMHDASLGFDHSTLESERNEAHQMANEYSLRLRVLQSLRHMEYVPGDCCSHNHDFGCEQQRTNQMTSTERRLRSAPGHWKLLVVGFKIIDASQSHALLDTISYRKISTGKSQ